MIGIADSFTGVSDSGPDAGSPVPDPAEGSETQ